MHSRTGITLKSFRIAWLSQVLLTGLILRALIPVGFMPTFNHDGSGKFQIVVCTSTGNQLITLDSDGVPRNQQDHKLGEPACAFAGVAHFALPETPKASLPKIVRITAVNVPSDTSHLPPARAGPAHATRAPPKVS